MRKSLFFRYNPQTDSYDRVYPSRRTRVWAAVKRAAWGIAGGAVVLIALYLVIDLPKEKVLRDQNRLLQQQIETLERRADVASVVMDDILQRDNNFYRVIMQTDRLPAAQRYAGLERERRYGAADSLPQAELLRRVIDKYDRLDRQLYTQIQSFEELRRVAATSQDRLDHTPAIQPISESNLKQMASGYGYRTDPIYRTTRFHAGMDFSADVGTPVYATADGTVAAAAWANGYGNCIDIEHGYNYLTRFAHLSEILVRPGQTVKRGDLIGKVGNSGKSTGPHLHYEVRYKDEPQNPVNYYFYDLTPEQYDRMIAEAENAGHMMD